VSMRETTMKQGHGSNNNNDGNNETTKVRARNDEASSRQK